MLFNNVSIFYLKLWMKLIDRGIDGASISNIALRIPTNTIFTDASRKDIGGHHIMTCGGWNLKIPQKILEVRTINHLEFLKVLCNH